MNPAYKALRDRLLPLFCGERLLDEALFNEVALEVFAFQWADNAPYRRFCEHLGRSAPQHWREIPAVPTDAFKQAMLFAFPREQAAKCFLTSGTTGEARGAHYFRDTDLYDASIQAAWAKVRRPAFRSPPEEEVFLLTQSPHSAPQSSLSHMMGVLAGKEEARYFLDAAGQWKWANLLAALESAIAQARPVLIMGTALAYLHFFERLDGQALRLPAGSWCLETGGYKGSGRSLSKADLYAEFERCLGLPAARVVNEYSMTELSSQFYSAGLDRYHWGPPWTRATIHDPETGKEVAVGGTGYLQIHDLANLGSVAAIATQDLATRAEAGFFLVGRDPHALERGCSRAAEAMLRSS